MDRLIKLAKRILVTAIAVDLLIIGIGLLPNKINPFGLLEPTLAGYVLFSIFLILGIVALISMLLVTIFPFYILAIKNKPLPTEESQIMISHLFLLFSPVVSLVSVIFLNFIPSPFEIRCAPLIVSLAEQIFSFQTLYFLLWFFVLAPPLISFVISAILLILRRKVGRNTILLSLLVIMVHLISVGFFLSITLASLNSARSKSVDAKRISDIKQTQIALELYSQQFNFYPKVEGETPYERLVELGRFLSPKFIPKLADDPCLYVSREYQYDYKNSSDGKSYVMKAILNDIKNPALDRDTDGEVFGVWCGNQGEEREYCVGSNNLSKLPKNVQ